MTNEEMILLNCVLYDPHLKSFFDSNPNVTLADWANQAASSASEQPGMMTPTEWDAVIAAVKSNPNLSSLTIANVDQRDLGKANQAVFTSKDSMIVAYQGTESWEWLDNGLGGHADVTETPAQVAAAEYYRKMVDKFGEGKSLITTGHSKGGNLAQYVAVVTADDPKYRADSCVNADGQGFNKAFQLKYANQIAQMKDRITTLAGASDYVNILFDSISGHTYYFETPSHLQGSDYFLNHSPFAMLQISGGQATIRSMTVQDPKMRMADSLMAYLQAYMSADDFALLCDTVMSTRQKGVTLDPNDIFDMDKVEEKLKGKLSSAAISALLGGMAGASLLGGAGLLAAAVGGLLGAGGGISADLLFEFLIGANGGWSDDLLECLKEPYRSMFTNLLRLLGDFYQDGGMSQESLDAIQALLHNILPGDWGNVAIDFASYISKGTLNSQKPLPYSSVTRDFTESMKQKLLKIVDEVSPGGWFDSWGSFTANIGDGFSDTFAWLYTKEPSLRFDADNQARTAYYKAIMDRRNTSKKQIEKIFDDVNAEDLAFAQRIDAIEKSADSILAALRKL